MNIKILSIIYLCIALTSFYESFASAEPTAHSVFAGVRMINPNFYTGMDSDGVRFYMERIDDAAASPERRAFWKKYIDDEFDNENTYRMAWAHGEIPPKPGFLRYRDRSERLTSGIWSFRNSLYHHKDNELWICYSSYEHISNPEDVTIDAIEMAVPVLTMTGSPVVTHMGISRSFHYLLNALKSESLSPGSAKLTHGLSMKLHSFAAKVMKNRAGESLLYMITSPVPVMRNIMLKALGTGIYIGDNISRAQSIYEVANEQVIKDWKNEVHKIEADINALGEEMMAMSSELRMQHVDEFKQKNDVLEKELKAVTDRYTDQKDVTIKAIAYDLPMTIDASPIRKIDGRIEIYNKDRTRVVMNIGKNSDHATVYDREIVGDTAKIAGGFFHSDMTLNPYVTIDIDVLATYLRLV